MNVDGILHCSRNEVSTLINAVKLFSEDIREKFDVGKCAKLVTQRGRVRFTDSLLVNEGMMKDASVDKGYKHTGIQQNPKHTG